MTGRKLAAGLSLLLTLAACGASGPRDVTYTFNPTHSAVKVDTPQLRALKAAAGIAACPSTHAVAGAAAANDQQAGLPSITLPCLGGGRDVQLAGLRGPLVLNFWAQTCGSCREESPLLQGLWASAGDRVHVMGVDFFDPIPAYALEFAKEYGLTYPQVADPDAATKADLHIAALPTTLLIDSTGRITYTQIGAIKSAAELRSLVRQHLGVAVPAEAAK